MHDLFLTGLEKDIVTSSNPIYLGDWVSSSSSNTNNQKKPFIEINNHWNDKEKLFRDHEYLEEIHAKTLLELSKVLNNIHYCSYSTRFWQTIMDPWLLSYIAIIFDRWETINKTYELDYKLKVYAPFEKYKHEISRDCIDYIDIYNSDYWNHNLFIDIINNQSNQKLFKIKYLNNFPKMNPIHFKNNSFQIENFKNKLKNILDKLTLFSEKFLKPPKVYLDLSYVGKSFRRDLNLGLNQNPFYKLYFLLDQEINSKQYILEKNISRIPDIKLGDSNFEKFLTKRISIDIPVFLVEEFSKNLKLANNFYQPQLIISDNNHINNLIFKFWLAICQENKTCIILSNHGGSINQSSLDYMGFEESISDTFITWTKPILNKHFQLPPLKYYKYKRNKKVNSKKILSIVGVDKWRYTLRCQVGPKSGQVWLHHNQIIKLYNFLEIRYKKITRIRPYIEYGRGLSKIYEKKMGKKNVSKKGSFNDYIDQSSLVICTYPETTFSDCIARNIPAILMYPESLWQIHPKIKSLYEILFDANLIFHDPIKLANHINSIFSDLESWWNSETVRNAIKNYENEALNIKGDYLQDWISFIRTKASKL